MGRSLSYIPPDESGWRVTEVTARIQRGTLLLTPNSILRSRINGIIGRAQRLVGVRIYGYTYLSNHFHMLLGVHDALQRADFMRRIQGQTTVELRHLTPWQGPAWDGRFKRATLAHEERLLAMRMKYLLSQGCKEGLVPSPLAWPGASTTKALCSGEMSLKGTWIDRTAFGDAQKSREGARRAREERFASEEKIILSKLPGYEHMSDSEYGEWIKDMVVVIERKTLESHKLRGTKPMGLWNVSRVSPLRVPRKVAWGARPRIIASKPEERKRLREAYQTVEDAYYEAREKRDATQPAVAFPEGTFPSPRRFVVGEQSRAGP